MYSILACLLFLEEFKMDCQDEHKLAFASFFWLVIFSPIAATLLKVVKPGFLSSLKHSLYPTVGKGWNSFLEPDCVKDSMGKWNTSRLYLQKMRGRVVGVSWH